MPGCMLYAKEVQLTLPGSNSKLTMVDWVGDQPFDKYKSLAPLSIRFAPNSGNLSNYPQNGEGTWVNSDNVGTITMCGRQQAGGDQVAMVLGSGIAVGSQVTSLTLSAGNITAPEGLTINPYTLMIAVYDGTTQVGSATGTAGATSLTLNPTGGATSFVWGENYKIIAIVKGGSNATEGKNTVSYTIDGIQVKADITVPEPTTATLSLMALAGLCVRRRRQRV